MPEELVIRTMKNDMADTPSKSVALDTPEELGREQSESVKQKPSKKKMQEEKSIIRPEKKRINTIIGIAYIALFFVLLGAAAYAYTWWTNNASYILPQETVAAVYEVIPRDAVAVVDYSVGTSESRQAIQAWWSERVDNEIGNPLPLLSIPDITHAYYVLMPDNIRPFLLLKKTEGTTQFVSTQSDKQVLDYKGWYIMHALDTKQYADALAVSAITQESPLVPTEEAADYLVQYALSPVFVSQEFNAIASSTIGMSRLGGLVFRVTSTSEDGTMWAAAHNPGEPPTQGFLPQTGELMSLIPEDVTFSYVGLRFADELMKWQEEGAKLDGVAIAQPSVRQFLMQLTDPYAVFGRQGADGVRDIGIMIALPESLKKQIHTGDPVIEQALPALIPLIVGKSLGIQVVFQDGEYKGVPLRYVNLNGQTQALDYLVGDNFILVASSREGMSSLIDTVLKERPGMFEGEQWSELIQKAAAVMENRSFMLGNIQDPALLSVLPAASAGKAVPVIVSSHNTSIGTDIQAVLFLE